MPNPSLLEFATIANSMYYCSANFAFEGWNRVALHMDDISGLAIGVFKRSVDNVILFAIRGTANFANSLTDFRLIAGQEPDIFKPGLTYVQQKVAELSASSTSFFVTGHSLGALVAEMIAVKRAPSGSINHDLPGVVTLPFMHAITFESPGSEPWLEGVDKEVMKQYISTYQVDRYYLGGELQEHPQSYNYINTAFSQAGKVYGICTHIGGAANQLALLRSGITSNIAASIVGEAWKNTPKFLAKLLEVKELHSISHIKNAIQANRHQPIDKTNAWPVLLPDAVIANFAIVTNLSKQEVVSSLAANREDLSSLGMPSLLLTATGDTDVVSVTRTLNPPTNPQEVTPAIAQPTTVTSLMEDIHNRNLVTKETARSGLGWEVDINNTNNKAKTRKIFEVTYDDINVEAPSFYWGMHVEENHTSNNNNVGVEIEASIPLKNFYVSDVGLRYKHNTQHEKDAQKSMLVFDVVSSEKCQLKKLDHNLSRVSGTQLPEAGHYITSGTVVKGYRLIATGTFNSVADSSDKDINGGIQLFGKMLKLNSTYRSTQKQNSQSDNINIQVFGIGGYVPCVKLINQSNFHTEMEKLSGHFSEQLQFCVGEFTFSPLNYQPICIADAKLESLRKLIDELIEKCKDTVMQRNYYINKLEKFRIKFLEMVNETFQEKGDNKTQCIEEVRTTLAYELFSILQEIQNDNLIFTGESYRITTHNNHRDYHLATCADQKNLCFNATTTEYFNVVPCNSPQGEQKFYLQNNFGKFLTKIYDNNSSKLGLTDNPSACYIVPIDNYKQGHYCLALENEAINKEGLAKIELVNIYSSTRAIVSFHSELIRSWLAKLNTICPNINANEPVNSVKNSCASPLKDLQNIIAKHNIPINFLDNPNGLPDSKEDMSAKIKDGISSNKDLFEYQQRNVRYFIERILPKLFSAEEHSLIYVIGHKGVGKSTLINSMVGHRLIADPNDSGTVQVIKRGSADVAPMGNGDASVTPFPSVYTASQSAGELSFCDTSGFGDKRDHLNGFALSITKALSKEVKAMVIVVDYQQTITGRGDLFFNDLETLNNIISDFDQDQVKDNLVFIINMKGKKPDKNVFTTFADMITNRETNLAEYRAKRKILHDFFISLPDKERQQWTHALEKASTGETSNIFKKMYNWVCGPGFASTSQEVREAINWLENRSLEIKKFETSEREVKQLRRLVMIEDFGDGNFKAFAQPNVIIWENYTQNIRELVEAKLLVLTSNIEKKFVNFENIKSGSQSFSTELVNWMQLVSNELQPVLERKQRIEELVEKLDALSNKVTDTAIDSIINNLEILKENLYNFLNGNSQENIAHWLTSVDYGDLNIEAIESYWYHFFYNWYKFTKTADMQLPGSPPITNLNVKNNIQLHENGSLVLKKQFPDTTSASTQKPYAEYAQDWNAWMKPISRVKVGVARGLKLDKFEFSVNVNTDCNKFLTALNALKQYIEDQNTLFTQNGKSILKPPHKNEWDLIASNQQNSSLLKQIELITLDCQQVKTLTDTYIKNTTLAMLSFQERKKKFNDFVTNANGLIPKLVGLKKLLENIFNDTRQKAFIIAARNSLLEITELRNAAQEVRKVLEEELGEIEIYLARKKPYYQQSYEEIRLVRLAKNRENQEGNTIFDPYMDTLEKAYCFSLERIEEGWELQRFSDGQDTFYDALADQLGLTVNDEKIKNLKQLEHGTNLHAIAKTVARILDINLAIVNKKYSLQDGFIVYYIDQYGKEKVTCYDDVQLPNKATVRLAYVDKAYLSVYRHPALSNGALKNAWKMPRLNTDNSVISTFDLGNTVPVSIKELLKSGVEFTVNKTDNSLKINATFSQIMDQDEADLLEVSIDESVSAFKRQLLNNANQCRKIKLKRDENFITLTGPKCQRNSIFASLKELKRSQMPHLSGNIKNAPTVETTNSSETEFQQAMPASSKLTALQNQGAPQWSMKNSNPAFIAQMNSKIREVVPEHEVSDKEENQISCAIS